jgi:hypothetical protein
MSLRYRDDRRPPLRVMTMALSLVLAATAGAALGFVWPDDEDEQNGKVQQPESAQSANAGGNE